MTIMLRGLALAATLSLALVSASLAQDAMATDAMASDAMAPAGDAMMAGDAMAPTLTPLTDDEFKLCIEQAGGITFPATKASAEAACKGLHQGMDVMATLESMGMAATGGDAMASDAMAAATK